MSSSWTQIRRSHTPIVRPSSASAWRQPTASRRIARCSVQSALRPTEATRTHIKIGITRRVIAWRRCFDLRRLHGALCAILLLCTWLWPNLSTPMACSTFHKSYRALGYVVASPTALDDDARSGPLVLLGRWKIANRPLPNHNPAYDRTPGHGRFPASPGHMPRCTKWRRAKSVDE